jgi:hypothetical protein
MRKYQKRRTDLVSQVAHLLTIVAVGVILAIAVL